MMKNWLQELAYRISIGLGIFIIAGISIMLITLLTISYQVIRAAVINPVNSLRAQ